MAKYAREKKVKKAQLGKRAQIEKLVKQSQAAMITVRLPSQAPVHRPLKQVTPLPVMVPVPVKVYHPQTLPVRLPPQAPLRKPLKASSKFLHLPGEIRNKIYGYAFEKEFYEIRWADKTNTSLTYRLPKRPGWKQPQLEPGASRRRRLWDWPRRVRSKEEIPTYRLSPGPAALLLTCKTVNAEASPLFYGTSTFTFQNLGTFDRFLHSRSATTLSSIRSIHLKHHTAGNAFWLINQEYKRRYDRKWDTLCLKAADELTNLEELGLDLTINDTPLRWHEDEPWMLAVLSFELIGLRRCSVKFRAHYKDQAVLEVEAYKLRQELLGDLFVDGAEGESEWIRPPPEPQPGSKVFSLRPEGGWA